MNDAISEKFNPKAGEARAETIAAVKALSPWAVGEASDIKGHQSTVMPILSNLDPKAYGKSRNHLDGAVTQLSPFIRHGALTLDAVRNAALDKASPQEAEKFIQQLAWRDYWQRLYARHPERIWNDVEPYKTGFGPDDYADELPEDVATAQTGTACIDQFLTQLITTGWIHNHARLYLAGPLAISRIFLIWIMSRNSQGQISIRAITIIKSLRGVMTTYPRGFFRIWSRADERVNLAP